MSLQQHKSNGALVSGQLEHAFDTDFFRFNFQAGRNSSIEFRSPSITHQLARQLFRLLFHAPNRGESIRLRAPVSAPGSLWLYWTAPHDGTYSLSVEHCAGDHANYSSRVAARNPSSDDHGDDEKTATTISTESPAAGFIDYPSDVDFFSFNASDGYEYHLLIKSETLEAPMADLVKPDGRRAYEDMLFATGGRGTTRLTGCPRNQRLSGLAGSPNTLRGCTPPPIAIK